MFIQPILLISCTVQPMSLNWGLRSARKKWIGRVYGVLSLVVLLSYPILYSSMGCMKRNGSFKFLEIGYVHHTRVQKAACDDDVTNQMKKLSFSLDARRFHMDVRFLPERYIIIQSIPHFNSLVIHKSLFNTLIINLPKSTLEITPKFIDETVLVATSWQRICIPRKSFSLQPCLPTWLFFLTRGDNYDILDLRWLAQLVPSCHNEATRS